MSGVLLALALDLTLLQEAVEELRAEEFQDLFATSESGDNVADGTCTAYG